MRDWLLHPRLQFNLRVMLVVILAISIWLAVNRERFSRLAWSESRALATYSQKYAPNPNGPNHRKTHRYVVTLRPDVSVMQFFLSLDGMHFTQQWCLMPSSDGVTRIGIDTTDNGKPYDFVEHAKAGHVAEQVRRGSSGYLDAILGKCVWREAHNDGPFELVMCHITKGTSRHLVHTLLGQPKSKHVVGKGSTEVFEYRSFHWQMTVTIEYDSEKVRTHSHRVHVQGPPSIPTTTNSASGSDGS